MAIEIERKFLLANDDWHQQVIKSVDYRQGYLSSNTESSIRVRIEGEQAKLNIKSATLGVYRHEYEYPIPLDEAQEILETLCRKPLVEKTRHFVLAGDHEWEIDEFEGENSGLVVAEIELSSENDTFEKPAWLGAEVSDDPRYYNVSLVSHPYKDWDR